MTGQNFMEEIDCASFFDHIDDLIEFPPVTDTPLHSADCNELPNIWTDNSGNLKVSDPIFSSSKTDSASVLSAELAVPYEDIIQLEWLSNFVEDSFSGGGMTINKENVSVQNKTVPFQTSSPVSVLESSSSSSSSSSCSGDKMVLSPIQRGPQRARSKRARPATFNPRVMIELLLTGSVSPEAEKPNGPTDQKKKKKLKKPETQFGPANENENENENKNKNEIQNQGVRKCMHCEITKTPQWRAGALGPKTLCNACGVRYKSGRLFPEYRPAASPTFVPSLHSNSHKKVVEMRIKGAPEPEPELIPNINPQADYV